MIRYKCAKCGKTLQSPESEAGDTLDCPECGNVNRVPMLIRRGSSFPAWIVLVILAAIGIPIVGVLIIAFIVGVAFTTLGASPNVTFGKAGNKLQDKRGGPAVKDKAKPNQPIEHDDKDE